MPLKETPDTSQGQGDSQWHSGTKPNSLSPRPSLYRNRHWRCGERSCLMDGVGSSAALWAAPCTYARHLLAVSWELPTAAGALSLTSALVERVSWSFLVEVTKQQFSFQFGVAQSPCPHSYLCCARLRSSRLVARSTYCWLLVLSHLNLPFGSWRVLGSRLLSVFDLLSLLMNLPISVCQLSTTPLNHTHIPDIT